MKGYPRTQKYDQRGISDNGMLRKRDCGMEMCLTPCGAGWTSITLDIGGDHLRFVISNVVGDQFEDLLKALYHLHPECNDYEQPDDLVYLVERRGHVVSEPFEAFSPTDCGSAEALNQQETKQYLWQAAFSWDEEGASINWLIERDRDVERDFDARIRIEICRETTETYEYAVRFSDFCYAVSKAATTAMKTFGFCGYHRATLTQDINVRILLYVKAVALNAMNVLATTHHKAGAESETISSYAEEMGLLLFDM